MFPLPLLTDGQKHDVSDYAVRNIMKPYRGGIVGRLFL